jgi:hypothetical protein
VSDELFTHTVRAWTAGELRMALEGVPDDFPVRVVTAEEPGSRYAGPEQVVISAGPWNDQGADGAPADHFSRTEFPSRQYYRQRSWLR